MMLRLRFAVTALTALALATSSAAAQSLQFGASMDAGEETTPISSTASGNVIVNVDSVSGALTLIGTFTGLTSNITAAHIHGPAARGQIANPVVTLSTTGTTTGTLSGNAVLTAQQVTDFAAGLTYVNVHSANFSGGEIRGQLDMIPSTDCPAQLGTDPVLTDVAGAPLLGPNIADPLECFGVTLDCSGAAAPGVYAIQIRRDKFFSPAILFLGHLWISGPKLASFAGMQAQNAVMAGPIVLPNDVSLVGRTYNIQGFCGGRLSNALQEHIGLP